MLSPSSTYPQKSQLSISQETAVSKDKNLNFLRLVSIKVTFNLSPVHQCLHPSVGQQIELVVRGYYITFGKLQQHSLFMFVPTPILGYSMW